MTVLGDVGIELLGCRAEALVVGLRIEGDSTVRDEQRARLQEVTVGPLGRRVTRHDPDAAAVAHHARAARRVDRGQRLVADTAAGGPHLAERAIRVAHEEATDHGLLDRGRPADDVQALRSREEHHAHARPLDRMAHGVHRGGLAVVEGLAPEPVLDHTTTTGRW